MSTPAPHKLTDHKYLIFDVYGTLVDWETGIHNALKPLLTRFRSASNWSRREVLDGFLSIELDIQAQQPKMLYSDLLAKAHEALEARLLAVEGAAVRGIDETKIATLDGHPPALSVADKPGEPSAVKLDTEPTPDAHKIFGSSIKQWAPFPDSSEALHELSKHFHLIVLSNVDHASFAHTHTYLSEGSSPSPAITYDQQAPALYSRPDPNPHPRDLWLPRKTPGSKSPFSLVLTAQDVGAYKPSVRGFLAAFEAIRSEPDLLVDPATGEVAAAPTIDDIKAKTLVVAQSLTHDHVPAKELGVCSVWIDRQGAVFRPSPPSDGKEFGWRWRFETLGDLAKAVEDEVRAE
ncbi:putative HAD-like protein [Lyophyllum shimeji]|uniref:HAD-like protein n=1 Tax=Lyophyllum shimeji TaxID=47721 RepID=A0A9P3PVP1_LYOSH|nr:putative HAD-like protein [Lyophyllum shimeji]